MAAGNDKVMAVSDVNFDAEVLKSDKPVLVDFWAPWCGPCRAVAPIVSELSNSYDGRLKVAKVNTDDAQETAIKFQIRNIPTLLLFKDGRVIDTIVGAVPKAKIVAMVDKAL